MESQGSNLSLDTSSDDDEDNIYLNSAARFKALRDQKDPAESAKQLTKNYEKPSQSSGLESSSSSLNISLEEDGFVIIDDQDEDDLMPPVKKPSQNSQQKIDNNIIEIDDSDESHEIIVPGGDCPARRTRSSTKTSFDGVINKFRQSLQKKTPSNLDFSLELVDTTFNVDDESPEEDDDPGIDIKIRWMSRGIERVHLGLHENFTKVFKHFAEIAKVTENQILIFKDGQPINPMETPSTLKLSIIDILEGGVTKFNMNMKDMGNDEPKCKIKIQASLKQFWTYDVRLNDPFEHIFQQCAAENKVKLSQIKCFFDGDLISPSDTPNDLDIDDEACFDLKITA